MFRPPASPVIALLLASLTGCGRDAPESLLPEVAVGDRVAVAENRLGNPEAPIPPQCYTRTEDRHNPCYTCHQMYDRRDGEPRMNLLDDGSLQGGYVFSEEGSINHWQNLFVDREDWLQQVSDEAILRYVEQDNYSDLAERLEARGWQGFLPDLADYQEAEMAFDERGMALDGSGWVAFNYKPFPGTFWPTNGSTDDVVIRLPEPFRTFMGRRDDELYLVNLSLLEMTIKQASSLSIHAVDETRLGVDLDGDGELRAHTTRLLPRDFYLGDAADIPVTFQQYPAGTELMHTVRYVGVDDAGNIYVPRRMKELRYMRKLREIAGHDLASRYARDRKEKVLGELPAFVRHPDRGLENGMGWMVQGYIEDYNGSLRPQNYEETLHCMGCHAAVGVTIDQTFALARKVPGRKGWGYIDTRGMPDAPSMAESDGEILNYLRRAGGGSEFRENGEMLARWYTADGRLDEGKLAGLDVHTLTAPSRDRALRLNKAYTHIVRHQSFVHGRDATWKPAINVFREIDESLPPLPAEYRYYGWDIRLRWPEDTGEPTVTISDTKTSGG